MAETLISFKFRIQVIAIVLLVVLVICTLIMKGFFLTIKDKVIKKNVLE